MIKENGSESGSNKEVTWREMMRTLKLENIKANNPGFFELSGGYKMKTKYYSDKSPSDLANAINDYIKFIGHPPLEIIARSNPRVVEITFRSRYFIARTFPEFLNWFQSINSIKDAK